MRWFLRALGLFVLLMAATAALAPGWVSEMRAVSSGAADTAGRNLLRQPTAPVQNASAPSVGSSASHDDVQPGVYVSPLFNGLAKLGGQISDTTGQADVDVTGPLAAADGVLARTKSQNRLAIRELSRPYRRVSPRSPHLLLVTVSGLTLEDVAAIETEEPASTLARMAQDGLRFTQYYTRHHRDQAWRELQSGLIDPDPSDRQQSLMDDVWKSGYLTALIGDCTQAPRFHEGDRHYDFRFGLETDQNRDSPYTDHVWSNGSRWDILADADGSRLRTQDLYLNEAASFIAAHRQGRPFFLHLTLDVSTPPADSHSDRLVRLDRRLAGLMKFLKAKSLERETVVILAGLGASRGDSLAGSSAESFPAAQRAPLLMFWPDRTVAKTTNFLCSTCDILPTIAHWTRAPESSSGDGVSLHPQTLNQRYDPGRVLVWHGENRIEKTVVAQTPWELILDDPPRLFDALRDPAQSEDLAGDLPSVLATLSSYVGVPL